MRAGSFELSYQIDENTNGRQLVIPDIHGCSKTFLQLLKKVNFQKSDQLFLLGDYINKGPDSKGVLDAILELIDKGYQVFPLRGNHEQILLDAHHQASNPQIGIDRNRDWSILNKSAQLRDTAGKVYAKYLPFLENLPYFYELPTHYLVHAGFNLKEANPFHDFKTMLWTKQFKGDYQKTNGKAVIIGHVPTSIQSIYRGVAERQPVIKLDNGCVYPNVYFQGFLLCYNLDTRRITPQINLDIKASIFSKRN